ncbi:hypothetical protein T02_7265 [Trichinella nativa]|uniref:Uncharacterized protein n=1 Tax=Trichinella nativa TaxID=6335 RepID=A0A0V1KH77_9BILA|nr:hypothetical protein T02_7265 [Trichinella nativa]
MWDVEHPRNPTADAGKFSFSPIYTTCTNLL